MTGHLPPQPGAPLGAFLEFVRDPTGAVLRWRSEHGPVLRLRLPWVEVWLVNEPTLIDQVLVTEVDRFIKDRFTRRLGEVLGNGLPVSHGELWKRQRRLIQGGFTSHAIRDYAGAIGDIARAESARWETVPADHDIYRDMSQLSLEAVTRALFSETVTEDVAGVGPAMSTVLHEFLGIGGTSLRLPAFLPTPGNLRFRQATAFLDRAVGSLIHIRREVPVAERPRDLLSHLMGAVDEDGTGMDDRQLRDELITLFATGHETTASSLSFVWYLLSQHPEAEARVHAEVDEVLAGRPVTFEDLPRLQYTSAVIDETLRLYPPVWGIGREPLEDLQIGDYLVPKGAQLFMMPWVVHRDPRFFDDPDTFRPERWLDGLLRKLPRQSYFPFGGGPRVCIGLRFALLELRMVVATLAQNWQLRMAPGERLDLLPALALRPRNGLAMVATRRGPRSKLDGSDAA